MLPKMGAGMMLFAAALAAVVAVVVTLSGNEDPASAVSAEPQAVEASVQERARQW